MQDHRAGRQDDARTLYRQVLELDPREPDAWHLLGVLEAESGRYDQAADCIGRAIEARPGIAMFHNNLGNVCMERGRFDEAKASYVRAIQLEPGRIDAMNNLGVLLSRRGSPEDAEKLLQAVIALAPAFEDAHQNLANHYLREGRLHEAVQQCIDGLVVMPRNTTLHEVLVLAYSKLGRPDEAAAVCRSWLECEPDNAVAAFHLQGCLGGAVPDRAPDAYVTQVFDGFAASFDAKLAALSYQAPALVTQAVQRHAGDPVRTLDVLDAGCGTGLCGPLLAPWAASLCGVDLSTGMLRKAKTREVYDRLFRVELVEFLRQQPAAFDLVASADTLCYFGALEPFASAAAAALRPQGLLVFTVESHADEHGAADFVLHGYGRYSHRRRYVESALRAAGLEPIELRAVELRTEAGDPVHGWLVSARA